MIQSVIGVSDDIDLTVAIEEVISECTKSLGDLIPQVGILFTSCMKADFPDILNRILQSFPGVELIGCTTDGEINRETGFIEDSISLLLLSSDSVEFSTAIARNLSDNAEASFVTAIADANLRLQSTPVCAFTFPDGLTTINIALGAAIQKSFGKNFPVFGGTAGDRFLFTETYQFHNDRVYSDAAPVLLIAGNLRVTAAVHKGPVPTGLYYRLDRYKNNVVYEIDGKTASSFFRDHLGDYQEQLSQFPLAVYEKGATDFYLKDPLHVNDEDESITFVGSFPEQCTVRFSLVSQKDALNAANRANFSVLKKETGVEPEVIFVFPCASLRHVLGSKTNEKFSLLKKDKRNIPFFGFYCYGEIAPFSIGTPTHFHSDTYVIVALGSVDK
ncbi:MAG: FIST N-terminal domain-containing protein [Desulforhopalus sp.]